MKLICITDVKMRMSNDIAFKKGCVYEWNVMADDSIQRYNELTGFHSFRADTWHQFFQFELVEEEV